MFYISTKSDSIVTNELDDCFRIFENERGILPSFSVCIDYLSNINIDSLKPVSKGGDYIFYQPVENGYWISFRGSYLLLSNDFLHADIYLSDVVRSDGQFEIYYLIMQAYMFRLVDTDNFMIHSAAVVYNESVILFCGMSGDGKSTQANLWKEYLDCNILNYDKPCVINNNEKIVAHGSPWSGKEKLIRNEYIPLKAIVFVRKSVDNYVVKLSPVKGFSYIYMNNYVYPVNEKIEDKYIKAVNKVAKNIPIYELYCDISERAVEVLYNELFEDKYENSKKGEN